MKQKAVSESPWLDWFEGVCDEREPANILAQDFLPDMLRRTREMKAEMMYLNSFMGA